PSNFQVCTEGKVQPCNQSFLPACGEDAIVCIVHPADEFSGTNFSAAAFQVREISRPGGRMTADICATPYPRMNGTTVEGWPVFLISAKHPAEIIGGIQFVPPLAMNRNYTH